MAVKFLECPGINEADFVGCNSNDIAIFLMKAEDIIVPASSEVPDIAPGLTELCQKRSRYAPQRM